jgi:hypothetical protein
MRESRLLNLMTSLLLVPAIVLSPALDANGQTEQKAQAERINEQKLASLMATVGIRVDRANYFVSGQTYQSLGLVLTTDRSANNSLIQTFTARVNSNERRTGVLPRHRSMELSSQHLVLVTVDTSNHLRWWSSIPDPRILRAEEPDANNRLSGRVIFQPTVEAMIEIPDDPSAIELRFYHPQWTDDRFVLTLVSTVALKKN